MKNFSLVVATEQQGGIGKNGALPWSLKGDMRWFKELTTCPDRLAVHARYHLDRAIIEKQTLTPEKLVAQLPKESVLPMPAPEARNAVLMGRRTWEGLPEKFRPLPGRINGVLSRTPGMNSDGTFHLWPNLEAALADLDKDETVREIFVIGGGQLYASALLHPGCVRVYRTYIEADYDCDTFFAVMPKAFVETSTSPFIEEAGVKYRIALLEKADPTRV